MNGDYLPAIHKVGAIHCNITLHLTLQFCILAQGSPRSPERRPRSPTALIRALASFDAQIHL